MNETSLLKPKLLLEPPVFCFLSFYLKKSGKAAALSSKITIIIIIIISNMVFFPYDFMYKSSKSNIPKLHIYSEYKSLISLHIRKDVMFYGICKNKYISLWFSRVNHKQRNIHYVIQHTSVTCVLGQLDPKEACKKTLTRKIQVYEKFSEMIKQCFSTGSQTRHYS